MLNRSYPGAAALVAALSLPSPLSAQAPVCHDQWPAWSPDGQSIVFVSTRTGDHEIYSLSRAEGRIIQLTDTPGRDAHPAFSPDGRTIAFQSPRGDGQTNLYLMRVDGGDVRQLTGLGAFSGMPAWSPDGESIAFQWRSEAPGAKWQLMVATLPDGRTQPLTDGSSNDQVVNWSPDGKRLLFHSDRTGMNQIYILEDDVVTRVAATPFDDRSATWSPDGHQIAFVRREGDHGSIHMMNVDGSDIRRVGDVVIEHSLPFFSPDGQELLITPTTRNGTEIWAVAVTDGARTRLSGC